MPSVPASIWLVLVALAGLLVVLGASLLGWRHWRGRRLDLPPLEQLRDATRHLHRQGELRAYFARSNEDASQLMLQKLEDAP